jgi:hypothetical protein
MREINTWHYCVIHPFHWWVRNVFVKFKRHINLSQRIDALPKSWGNKNMIRCMGFCNSWWWLKLNIGYFRPHPYHPRSFQIRLEPSCLCPKNL